MEKYYYKKTLIGIKITSLTKGSNPQTDTQGPVGVLTFKHPRGSRFPAHVHKPVKRITHQLQECFIVKKGRIKINLYGPDKKYFKTVDLKEGQLFLTVNGGHEITVLKDCEIFEIKNGPYKPDKVFI
ncbi:MAG: hypothetical protein NTZ93_02495 [Candidatus Beckwithbacteria bacterium]|nr:hypothetical protein [Candidatus Beckwithbacteria bacterium]